MLNTAAAAGSLQSNFKKVFDNVDKEVDLAVNHFVRAAGNAVQKEEIDEFRKRIGDSFTDLKKLLIKFNRSAFYFIGLNVEPSDPKLHDLVTLKKRKRKLPETSDALKTRDEVETPEAEMVETPDKDNLDGDGKNRDPQSSVEKGVKESSLVEPKTAATVEQVYLVGGDRKDKPVVTAEKSSKKSVIDGKSVS